MTVTPKERKSVLKNLVNIAFGDLSTLWKAADSSDQDFPRFFRDAFPELVDPYAAAAAELAAAWYDETPSETDYLAVPGGMPVIEALQKSVEWALGANGDKALTRLEGTLQRAVLNTARDTTVTNIRNEGHGAGWARYASANACAFCALMATRGVVYSSKESAGGTNEHSYHDHCSCLAVEVRPGGTYIPPDYVGKWDKAYLDASREVHTTDEILAHMRQSLNTH